jgi:hypothetical protein
VTKLGQRQQVAMPGQGDGKTGHPVFWHAVEAVDMQPFEDGGGYPKGFLTWAYSIVRGQGGYVRRDEVVHLCSGSVREGITVDIRPEVRPRIVADATATPLPSACTDLVLIDPPYTEEYARNLYGTEYPLPQALLREAARLVRPGGHVGLLHFQVPLQRSALRLVTVYGITTGPGYAIRAWTLYRREDEGLGL